VRFIIMHKTNAHWETGARPDPALIARVGALIDEMAQAGVFRTGEGLGPSAEGVRLRFAEGECTIVPGPFKQGNELPAGFSILRTATLHDAISWATQQAEILRDAEIDIRPVNEPWDIGLQSRPADLSTRRYMVLRKATAATEAGDTPSAESRSRLSHLIHHSTRTGVHLASENMAPSRKGRRYSNSRDGLTFYDGPFTETKELLGGYVIIEADSLESAARWAARYIETVGAEEVDVRELE
jgi:hypothetical protein